MTEDDIYIAVEAMLVKYTGVSVNNVLRAYPGQRISLPPNNDYIIMTFTGDNRLSTPSADWSETQYNVTQDKQGVVQLDFFGKNAKQRADIIVDLSRSLILCDYLEAFQIQPLYCDDAVNNTGVSDEKRYVPRWTVQLNLTYKTAVTVDVDTFTAAEFNIFNVEL